MKKLYALLFFALPAALPAQELCMQQLPYDSMFFCGYRGIGCPDLNHDGYDDIVYFKMYSTMSGTAYYLGTDLSNGDGTFTSTCSQVTTFPFYPQAAADFDLDGHVDFAGKSGPGGGALFAGDGAGCFQSTSISIPGYVNDLVIDDFNSDGRPDIAATNTMPNTCISFYMSNGLQYSLFHLYDPAFTSPMGLYAADINNDGLEDLVWQNSALMNYGNSNFAFVHPGTFDTQGTGDMNGDGFIDIFTSDSMQLNSGYGTFPLHLPLNLGSNVSRIGKPVDINHDGGADLPAIRGDGNGMDTLVFYLGELNTTSFTLSSTEFAVPSTTSDLLYGDFNGDGLTDIRALIDTTIFEGCQNFFCTFLNRTAHIIGAPQEICNNEPTLLSVNSTGSIFWSTGDTTSSSIITGPGMYAVTVTNGACASTDSADIGTLLEATFSQINNSGHFCLYASPIPLQSGMPAGGAYSGPGVSNGAFDPQAAGVGTHYLYYTYSGPNCAGTDSLQVIVDICLKAEEQNFSPELNVHPNPASENVMLEWNAVADAKIVAYDLTGRQMHNSPVKNAQRAQLNVAGWPEGIYFLQAEIAGKHVTRKIIVAR